MWAIVGTGYSRPSAVRIENGTKGAIVRCLRISPVMTQQRYAKWVRGASSTRERGKEQGAGSRGQESEESHSSKTSSDSGLGNPRQRLGVRQPINFRPPTSDV